MPFTAADYYQTRSGLDIWDSFGCVIGVAGEPVLTTPATKVTSFDLVANSTDEQIRAELPEDHVFPDASLFCSHLASLIDRQPNGKEGTLLNNGSANTFYVNIGDRVVAVRVYWLADGRGWLVRAYELRDSTWGAGSRVFSATAVA